MEGDLKISYQNQPQQPQIQSPITLSSSPSSPAPTAATAATATIVAPPTNSRCSIMSKKFDIGNPFPVSLGKRSQRAAKVMNEFLLHAQEQVLIPESSIATCKGLAIISMVKVNIIFHLSSFKFHFPIIILQIQK